MVCFVEMFPGLLQNRHDKNYVKSETKQEINVEEKK